MFYKKLFRKISLNSQKKTAATESSFVKLQTFSLQLYEKRLHFR